MNFKLALSTCSRVKVLHLLSRALCSKVPSAPIVTLERQKESKVKVDKNTLALLERLSLVKCDNAEGVKVLEDSIAFADKILYINTDNIEPLYSVLENEWAYLYSTLYSWLCNANNCNLNNQF